MRRRLGIAATCVVGIAAAPVGWAADADPWGSGDDLWGRPDLALAALADALRAAVADLAAQAEPGEAPHHAALQVHDLRELDLRAWDGASGAPRWSRSVLMDVDLRLGTAERDSSHVLRGVSSLDADERAAVYLPLDPRDGMALVGPLRRALDDAAREARERLRLLRGNDTVLVEEEHPAPDWEPRPGAVWVGPAANEAAAFDAVRVAAWADALPALSARLLAQPAVVDGQARLQVSSEGRFLVDTEGARLHEALSHARVSLLARAVAPDGDEIDVFRAFDAHGIDRLPEPSELVAIADEAAARAAAIAAAPRGEPFTGPVWLSGRASAVFFHEVMGHRVEGHRQKSDDEGQTFLGQLGRPVLPPFVDVVDDPTLATWSGIDLNGWYGYDDEGVAAAPALLVQDGTFRGFLMGRSPIEGFPSSNGHGRRSPGHPVRARMGNTLVTSDRMVDEAALRALLVAEARAQGLPYAYRVEEIDGGFTLTGREIPNSFNVKASEVWRVWVDGRPDELVRGLDLVGTPLAAFQNLLATGGEVEVFNGVCGAESGWVPVSAVAPAMVFRRMEFQLKDKASDRPPLRPRPALPATGTGRGA